MSTLPSIGEDMSYDSESSFEEQESERRRAEKVALLAVAIFCAENSRKRNAPARNCSADKKQNRDVRKNRRRSGRERKMMTGAIKLLNCWTREKKKDDRSDQTVNLLDEIKGEVDVSNQTVDPCDAGMEEEGESGSKGDCIATMEGNDDFVLLPFVSKAAER